MKKIIILLLIVSSLIADQTDRTISHKTYESIAVIQKLVSDNNSSGALQELNKLYKSIDNNRIKKYEKAFVNRMYGYVYVSDEKYDEAIEYFNTAYNYGAFIEKEQYDLLKNIAQIYMAKSEFLNAIKQYDMYIDITKTKDSEVYIALASAYAEVDDIDAAIKYVNKAIEYSRSPKESWYEMLLALHYEQDCYDLSANVQDTLIKKFGVKEKYLFRLSSLYQQSGDEHKALIALELAYNYGYLDTKEEYLRLISVLLSQELPEKSSRVIEDGMNKNILLRDKENLRLLADSYSMARDDKKALLTYKELAEVSNDGNVYAQVAQTYLNLEDYENAIVYFNKALESESLKNIASVYLLLGVSYYELHDYDKAAQEFSKAMEYDETVKSAKEWLGYIKK